LCRSTCARISHRDFDARDYPQRFFAGETGKFSTEKPIVRWNRLGGAAVVWKDGRPADCEAAIKRLLISLWLGAVVAQPAQASESEEVHSVVVDSPEVIDMSHASPDTWNTLTPPIELYKQAPAPDEVELPSLRHPTYPAAFRLR
jgi:hypothetical protein